MLSHLNDTVPSHIFPSDPRRYPGGQTTFCCSFRENTQSFALKEGREGVKWELGLALFWTGKMGFTHWDWDLATGNGMNNYKMGMGFLFFSGLCSNILN